MTKIFVYDDLLKDAELIGEAVTINDYYTMREFIQASDQTKVFPSVYKSKDEPGHHIAGKIYEVDDEFLKKLDEFKGCFGDGRMHDRITAKVRLNGDPVTFTAFTWVHTGFSKPHNEPEYRIYTDAETRTMSWGKSRASEQPVPALAAEMV